MSVTNVSTKFICIDATAALCPSQALPLSWMNNPQSPISGIRTFHYPGGSSLDSGWVLWAIQQKIQVLIGLTLGSTFGNELQALIDDYQNPQYTTYFQNYVIAIAVGNEISDPKAIVSGISEVREKMKNNQLPQVKITSVLKNEETWLRPTYPPNDCKFTSDFMDLVEHMDVICFNFYPYFAVPDSTVAIALSMCTDGSEKSILINCIGCVRKAMACANISSKEFWITETGWQGMDNPNPDYATIANEKIYYNNFLQFNNLGQVLPEGFSSTVSGPERMCYFTVRNVLNESFGLYKDGMPSTPKFT